MLYFFLRVRNTITATEMPTRSRATINPNTIPTISPPWRPPDPPLSCCSTVGMVDGWRESEKKRERERKREREGERERERERERGREREGERE